MLHKPHPGNIVKMYALRQVLEELQSNGYIERGGYYEYDQL